MQWVARLAPSGVFTLLSAGLQVSGFENETVAWGLYGLAAAWAVLAALIWAPISWRRGVTVTGSRDGVFLLLEVVNQGGAGRFRVLAENKSDSNPQIREYDMPWRIGNERERELANGEKGHLNLAQWVHNSPGQSDRFGLDETPFALCSTTAPEGFEEYGANIARPLIIHARVIRVGGGGDWPITVRIRGLHDPVEVERD